MRSRYPRRARTSADVRYRTPQPVGSVRRVAARESANQPGGLSTAGAAVRRTDSQRLPSSSKQERRKALAVLVSLVDVDPDLASGVPEKDVDLARRVLMRPRYDIPKGLWSPELLRAHDDGAFAVLLVDGALVRQLDLVDRHCMQILGPGDLLHHPSEDGVFDCPVSWTALRASAVVVLDERFTRASQRWPSLGL